MASAFSNSVFSVPLRHLQGVFPGIDPGIGELANPVAGLLRYVGDKQNELLRYFTNGNLPGENDWPVVLFGPSGTGKTALAMNLMAQIATAASVKFENPVSLSLDSQDSDLPKPKPAIFEAADFARKFNSAIATNSVAEFRQRMTSSTGILIDGVQSLAGKNSAQNELIYLLDIAADKNIPVIVTCLHSPISGDLLLPQLSSRLSSGLCLAVKLPGKEARLEIINELARIHGLDITEDAAQWLTQKLNVPVPKINQFFTQLVTNRQVTEAGASDSLSGNSTLDSDYFQQMFEEVSEEQVKKYTQAIIKAVAREMDLKTADLKSNSRKQSIVLARSIAIFLCRTLLKTSFVKIGRNFGNRDHSTIMHACRKIQSMIDEASTNQSAGSAPATVKMIEHLSSTLGGQFTGLLNTTTETTSESET